MFAHGGELYRVKTIFLFPSYHDIFRLIRAPKRFPPFSGLVRDRLRMAPGKCSKLSLCLQETLPSAFLLGSTIMFATGRVIRPKSSSFLRENAGLHATR